MNMKMWAIMRRDLLKLSRNPLTLLSTILMPIVYLVIIGNSFNGNLKHLSLAVVSQDHGDYGRRMVEKLQALEAGPKTVTLSYVEDLGSAIDDVRNGTYKAAVVIPPDFTKSVHEGRVAEIGVFTDNVDTVSSAALESVLDEAAATLTVNEYVTAREPKLNQIVLRPAELFTTVDYDRSLIPGVIVMSLFMGSLMSGVFNWVMDRFMGVTECYLVTPLSRWEIAGGILASGVTITSVAATIVLFAGLLITGATIQGGLPALLTIIGIIIVGATGLLAMTFAVLGRATHPRLVGTFAGFLNVILFFPSGAIYPIESFPGWLRTFARFNPEMHAVSALKSILFKGAVFSAVRADLTFLLVFTSIMLVVASMSFKRTL
jgi:ABC-2 type transport system permease protein